MKRLREIFPKANFTNGISSGVNENTTDLIVFLNAYISPKTYWLVKGEAERKHIRMLSTPNVNAAIIAQKICEAMK